MLADLTSAHSMIVSLMLPSQTHSLTSVPLLSKPPVKLRTIEGLLDAGDGLLNLITPSGSHEQGKLCVSAARKFQTRLPPETRFAVYHPDHLGTVPL
jgi:hypothetical protein